VTSQEIYETTANQTALLQCLEIQDLTLVLGLARYYLWRETG